MRPQNVLEAFFASFSIILEQIQKGVKEFFIQEKELIQHGEYDDEEIKE